MEDTACSQILRRRSPRPFFFAGGEFMNPIFTWIIAETGTRTTTEMLMRHCPKCRHKQVVPKEKLRVPAPCGKCGASLRPRSLGR